MSLSRFHNRVKETTTTTGTGTITLLGATTGYQSFSLVGDQTQTYYVIQDQSGSNWEIGIGTYTLATTTISRDKILASSNNGVLVNFSAGTKDVFIDVHAGWLNQIGPQILQTWLNYD